MTQQKFKLADRASVTDISGIRKVFDLAANLKSPINLSIGQPDFDVPDIVKEASIAGIRNGANSYTPTQGRADLIAGISKSLDAKYVQGEIIITSAVSGGLNLAFLALLNPGDEILIPDPYFVMYKQLALMLGAKPVYYDTYPDFNLPVDKIESLITEKTRAIVIGSPSNPTGIPYSENELQELVGEIQDEYDQLEEDNDVIAHSRDHIISDGQTHVSDINKALDEDIIPEDDDYETIGGFVLANLGHIPLAGEEFIYKHLNVKVLDADERRVLKVEVKREKG